ncbi:hypothetical protein NPIL_525021 [Nephila pilipes]|uniref:Uncharacterized protein n=1 Tax=Nephila pilipes TaxID=299642 RepID=A0A8X6NPI1_NEPPI|nr:hypothetical protein NPIL_525021 [Nephila pilipes]
MVATTLRNAIKHEVKNSRIHKYSLSRRRMIYGAQLTAQFTISDCSGLVAVRRHMQRLLKWVVKYLLGEPLTLRRQLVGSSHWPEPLIYYEGGQWIGIFRRKSDERLNEEVFFYYFLL